MRDRLDQLRDDRLMALEPLVRPVDPSVEAARAFRARLAARYTAFPPLACGGPGDSSAAAAATRGRFTSCTGPARHAGEASAASQPSPVSNHAAPAPVSPSAAMADASTSPASPGQTHGGMGTYYDGTAWGEHAPRARWPVVVTLGAVAAWAAFVVLVVLAV